MLVDAEKTMAFFTQLQGGVALIRWLAHDAEILPFDPLQAQVAAELGSAVVFSASFPLPALVDTARAEETVDAIVTGHLSEVERAMAIGRVGSLAGLQHLEPGLRVFLDDHPDYERNVFIMMRFLDTEQMEAIHAAIVQSLAQRGYVGIRADDRDFTGELWINVEVCMIGCRLGIAVFEDIEQRDFNPNVSLELGYMLGRQKRCLILKERRLPSLPADVVHRLYKPFDIFDIASTIEAQVGRWVDVDLGA